MAWETVHDEAPTMIVFDKPGDQFTGTYEGCETIEIEPGGETFEQCRFRNPEGYFGTNASYVLRQAMAKVTPGSLVRITYVKNIDTGQPSPMKDFKVEVAS